MTNLQFERAPGARGRGKSGTQGMSSFKPLVRMVSPSRARFEAKIDMELGKRQELMPVSLPSLHGWGQEAAPVAPPPPAPVPQKVCVYDALKVATPSQLQEAHARRERLARLSGPPAPRPRNTFAPPPIEPYRAPPIPNHLIQTAVDMLDAALARQPVSRGPVDIIFRAVLRFYPNITITDLKSTRRTADVVRARQVAMYLCRTLTLRSLPDIGRRLGDRDHTTVLHGFRKIEALLQADQTLAAQIEEIKAVVSKASAK